MRLGKGTAAELAKVTDVPRNKLYPVMQQLNQLGVVETLLGEAQVFRPLPLDRFVAERLEAMREQVRELDESREGLAALFRPLGQGEASPSGYRLFFGRANTLDQLRQALREARVEVAVVMSAGAPRRMLLSGEAELLRERLDDGVALRAVAPLLEENAAAAHQLHDLLGPSLTLLADPTPPCTLLAVDGARALQAQTQPDDASLVRGGDVCLVSQSPILARVVDGYARALAQAATVHPAGRAEAEQPEAPSPEAP